MSPGSLITSFEPTDHIRDVEKRPCESARQPRPCRANRALAETCQTQLVRGRVACAYARARARGGQELVWPSLRSLIALQLLRTIALQLFLDKWSNGFRKVLIAVELLNLSRRLYSDSRSRISVVTMAGAAIAIDDASATDTVLNVKQRVFAANRTLYVRRQRLVYQPGPYGMDPLADGETLGGAGVARDGSAKLDVLLADLTAAEVEGRDTMV